MERSRRSNTLLGRRWIAVQIEAGEGVVLKILPFPGRRRRLGVVLRLGLGLGLGPGG